MADQSKNPRILIVTPEVTYLPDRMGDMASFFTAKARGPCRRFSRTDHGPCLFTIHNIHTVKITLAYIEDRGIDAAYFWQNLYCEKMAESYEDARDTIPVDMLTSGIFAAHFVNVVSPTFLEEIVHGQHHFIEPPIQRELANKYYADCAYGILSAPDPAFNPATDKHLNKNYSVGNFVTGKRENKLFLQDKLGLIKDKKAPVFFWPSRLDPVQKGCQRSLLCHQPGHELL